MINDLNFWNPRRMSRRLKDWSKVPGSESGPFTLPRSLDRLASSEAGASYSMVTGSHNRRQTCKLWVVTSAHGGTGGMEARKALIHRHFGMKNQLKIKNHLALAEPGFRFFIGVVSRAQQLGLITEPTEGPNFGSRALEILQNFNSHSISTSGLNTKNGPFSRESCKPNLKGHQQKEAHDICVIGRHPLVGTSLTV